MNDVVNGDEFIFNKPIAVYFGSAITEKLQEELDQHAIEWNRTLAFVLNDEFKCIITNMMQNNEDGKNFFDLLFFTYSAIDDAYAPKILISSYIHNGFKYPMLIFKDGYLRDKKSRKKYCLRDDVFKEFGEGFEAYHDFQYIGFKRLALNEHWLTDK